MSYYSYIKSNKWKSKAKFFKLLACLYRLSPFPLIGYAHHTNYNNLYRETYLKDIIIVGDLSHFLIIHGILSGFKRPGEQDYYPNRAQKIFHIIYKVPFIGGVTGIYIIHSVIKLSWWYIEGGTL